MTAFNHRQYLQNKLGADVQQIYSDILGSVAYLQTVVRDGIEKIFFVAFKGKSSKAFINFDVTQSGHAAYLERFKSSLKQQLEYKQRRMEEKNNFKPSLALGDVLYSSWGYDQTNIDFYQVVGVSKSGSTVKVRQLLEEQTYDGHTMSGHTIPCVDEFYKDEILEKRVLEGNRIKINECSTASPLQFTLNQNGSKNYEAKYFSCTA